jgi:hypothetical protein
VLLTGLPLVIILRVGCSFKIKFFEGSVSGRTIPSWRIVVEAEIDKLRKFQDFLRTEDKLVFQDLVNQCKLYAPYAGSMAHTIKEVPLFISMLFGQHKRIIELEKKILMLETLATKPEMTAFVQPLQRPEEKLEDKTHQTN